MPVWKQMFSAGYKYSRKFKERNGKGMIKWLNKLEVCISCLLMFFFHFHHLVHILAAVLLAGLCCFLFRFTTTAGLLLFFTHLNIHQLSLAVMQVYRGPCGAAQVDESQYENQELFHATQK